MEFLTRLSADFTVRVPHTLACHMSSLMLVLSYLIIFRVYARFLHSANQMLGLASLMHPKITRKIYTHIRFAVCREGRQP